MCYWNNRSYSGDTGGGGDGADDDEVDDDNNNDDENTDELVTDLSMIVLGRSHLQHWSLKIMRNMHV